VGGALGSVREGRGVSYFLCRSFLGIKGNKKITAQGLARSNAVKRGMEGDLGEKVPDLPSSAPVISSANTPQNERKGEWVTPMTLKRGRTRSSRVKGKGVCFALNIRRGGGLHALNVKNGRRTGTRDTFPAEGKRKGKVCTGKS